MWTGIAIGGGGLLLGLGIMIWALVERAKRHAAERAADQSESERLRAHQIAEDNIRKVAEIEKDKQRAIAQLAVLRSKIEHLQSIISKSKDPEVISHWLDSEMKGEEL